MDDTLINEQKATQNDARLIESFMGHKGFDILKEIVKRTITDHANIENIKDLKDLQATQKAVKMVNKIFEELEAIKESGYQATEILEKVEQKDE